MPQASSQPIRKSLKGVFSEEKTLQLGTGATKQRTQQKTYHYAEEQSDGNVALQALNKNMVPFGQKTVITMNELLDGYTPEPDYFLSRVYPRMQELEKAVLRGDKHRQKGETFSAEYEYGKALAIDEENIRANFGIGLVYLARGAKDKAREVFDQLVRLEGSFDSEHKHLFNDFGISLRKNSMYDEAMEYYRRALHFSEGDDHLWYNMARCQLEMKDVDEALASLRKALELNPYLEEARELVSYIKKKFPPRS